MVILSGAHSLIGNYLLPMLRNEHQVCAFDSEHGDIRDSSFIEQLFREVRPDIFINCEQNDNIEDCEYKREDAYVLNGLVPTHVAELCAINKVLFVHMSSIYLFDGKNELPYKETDTPNPTTVFGDSKSLAEKKIVESGCRHLIVRLPHVYGRGPSFLSQYVDRIKDAERILLPEGQMIMPTYALDAAKMILSLVGKGAEGIYNCANEGCVKTKEFLYEFAVLMGKRTGRNYIVNIEECDSEEYLAPYDIPLNCTFDITMLKKILDAPVRRWNDALGSF
ncbi:MAG TPA: sugar nucleotide-binding protein, partial [Spirochaetota bacterium]